MGEEKNQENRTKTSNISAILNERDRLEKIIQEKFKKEVAILFTDICGYTTYTDTHGDISGRAMLQKHNEIVLPLIEKEKGIVIKTIGDAVMGSFESALTAVNASIAIQKGLNEYNRTAEERKKIYVKIGINKGEALVDEADVYGDVVNVASRIQSQAGSDQILVSNNVYDEIKGVEDILCRFHGKVSVKGKAEPVELYRVVWQDEDIVLTTEPKIRAYEEAVKKKAKKLMRVFCLEIFRVNNHLKISTNEHFVGEEKTIGHYEEMPVSMDWINKKCSQIAEDMNRVIKKGQVGRDVLLKLRETGRIFYNKLFTAQAKEKLEQTKAEFLTLHIDDQLVQVPWELLNNGKEFLCQRFNMGRLVKTRQKVENIKSRLLARPLKMLILSDLIGDLKDAYLEGVKIRDYLAQEKDFINVALRSKDVTSSFLKEKLKYFDIVHFAGHAEYSLNTPEKSGWKVSDGEFTAQDIINMGASSSMPSLIFSNACQSARTEEWKLREHFQSDIFGLANSFLLSGVKHYVGTFWNVLDKPSRHFALDFYNNILFGLSVGEAVRKSRLSLIKEFGEETLVWSSYVLYGDPTSNYMDQIKLAEQAPEDDDIAAIFTSDTKTRDAQVDNLGALVARSKDTKHTWAALAAGVGLALLIVILIFVINQNSNNTNINKTASLNSGIPIQAQNISGKTAQDDYQIAMQTISLLSSYQDQLTKKFKEKGFFTRDKEIDSWTSRPISICMIEPNWAKIDSDSTNSIKPHFNRLLNKMTAAFTQVYSMGLSILERKRLSAIFQELHLGSLNLSDQSLKDAYTILSAQVILFPEPITYETEKGIEPEVNFRMVETKSTKILAAFSKAFSLDTDSIENAVSNLSEKTVQNLKRYYPLQGRILSLEGESVRINLGNNLGLLREQSFSVRDKDKDDTSKGTIQIKEINDNTSIAKIENQRIKFKVGDRIKVIPK